MQIPLRVGFPIRISTDQSLFAAPRGFSQRTTSFIASRRQGIHQMPLRRLTRMTILTTHNGKYPSSITIARAPVSADNRQTKTSDRHAPATLCRTLFCLLTSVRQTPRGDYKPSSLCQKTRSQAQTQAAAQNFLPYHQDQNPKMVGLGRLELPTSRLSSARSNQLSYRPSLIKETPSTS